MWVRITGVGPRVLKRIGNVLDATCREPIPVQLYCPEAKGFNIFCIEISVLNHNIWLHGKLQVLAKVKSKVHIYPKSSNSFLVLKTVLCNFPIEKTIPTLHFYVANDCQSSMNRPGNSASFHCRVKILRDLVTAYMQAILCLANSNMHSYVSSRYC